MNEDLDWLAFRYVAGELTPPEASAFEERLASDQAAREAVSRAAELGIQLAAARPLVTPRRGFAVRILGPLAWASLGAAASLVAWTMLQGQPRPEANRQVAPQPEEPRAAGIDAVAWMQLRSVTRIEKPLEEVESEDFEVPTPRGPVVPGWLLQSGEKK